MDQVAKTAKPRTLLVNEPRDGRRRVVIDRILPSAEGGLAPIKRVTGDRVDVEAHVFTDGHDGLTVRLLWRPLGEDEWAVTPMTLRWNDEWLGTFTVQKPGLHEYTVEAWVDHYLTWARDLEKRAEAGQELDIEFAIGAGLLKDAARRASGSDREALRAGIKTIEAPGSDSGRVAVATDPDLVAVASAYPERSLRLRHEPPLTVIVDPPLAGFSAWYEMFPRSASTEPGRHGTFRDVEARLPYVAEMGFDVLYLPPIHPVGSTKRKGPNNRTVAMPDDTGSPWAIGDASGGHKAIHPLLGTLADFRRLVAAARDHGLAIALDIAFQCSPDHPYVKTHPDWFKMRPDGSVQYAENPPKRYEDIYPFNFETADWRALWDELKSVFDYWIAQGVTVFRVDNPHTKPFRFWEWCIGEVKREHPETIFLAEAFTRPKIMSRLARLGFTQSYTYFTWRTEKSELEEYLEELSQSEMVEFFRPNFWPNTPDILTEQLHTGSRPTFLTRFLLAATLSPNYGIYGPPFELLEHIPREPGSEEYRDSEKYEIRYWDLDRPESLAPFIGHVNRLRRANPAFSNLHSLRFHPVDNEQLLAYSKRDEESGNTLLIVVNLDAANPQAGWLTLDREALALEPGERFDVEDLLVGTRYTWGDERQYLRLDPDSIPAHIFRVDREGVAHA